MTINRIYTYESRDKTIWSIMLLESNQGIYSGKFFESTRQTNLDFIPWIQTEAKTVVDALIIFKRKIDNC